MAVKASYKEALKHQGNREIIEVILLSPGSYADENYLNEFDRGNKFKEAVQNLIRT